MESTEIKLVNKILFRLQDEYIGSFENDSLNYSKEYLENEWPLKDRTCDNVCDYLYREITNGNSKYIQVGNMWIERKHLKFIGTEKLKELIRNNVIAYHYTVGWGFEDNFAGDLK